MNNKNLNMMIISEWLDDNEYQEWNELITRWGDPLLESDQFEAVVASKQIAHLIETARGRWLNYKQGATLVKANKLQSRVMTFENGATIKLVGKECDKYKGCECPKCRNGGLEGSQE